MNRHEIKISDSHTRIIYGDVVHKPMPQCGISVIETRGVDGSALERPTSSAYLRSIRNRQWGDSDTGPTTYPGDYGSGKKVPRER